METTQLTQLELVLLEFVKKGQGKWSWYEIASALSRRDVPREPDMMVVLKKLAQEGFIQRYLESDSPRDRWELTAEGEKLLNHQISIPTTLHLSQGENALVLEIPACVVEALNLQNNERVICQVENGKLIVVPARETSESFLLGNKSGNKFGHLSPVNIDDI